MEKKSPLFCRLRVDWAIEAEPKVTRIKVPEGGDFQGKERQRRLNEQRGNQERPRSFGKEKWRTLVVSG